MPGLRALLWLAAGLVVVMGVFSAWLLVLERGTHDDDSRAGAADAVSQTSADGPVERGAYLAKVGACAACHTIPGGAPYAGGRGLPTPFGIVYAGNITPDVRSGIGTWVASDFWRALHHGRSKDGRMLFPAFPYTDYTLVTRNDSDALFAYLRVLPAVYQPNRSHELRFPYRLQASLAVWRALYFRPGRFETQAQKSPEWNRGAYLVRGLGHCAACHAPRNFIGASQNVTGLDGGLIAGLGWVAPPLAPSADTSLDGTVALLRDGVGPRGAAMGPMAGVVFHGTQHLTQRDLVAMATYLQELPPAEAQPGAIKHADTATLALGATIYRERCADCHGEQGQGQMSYPPLAGNATVQMSSPLNTVRVIVGGGFAATTAGNPRPFGMPPFGHELDNGQIAAVASYLRSAWGNQAAPVTEVEVILMR